MTANEIVDQISAEQGMSKTDARKLVASLLMAIGDAVARGDEVALNGFGKFKVRHSAAREGRNPATGEAITIKASKKLTFTPAKAIKDRLNG